MTWLDSDWKARLTDRLEPLLKSPELVAEISTYDGVPFALFAYPPTVERELRREVKMLATRIEQQSARRVTIISLAAIMWDAMRVAYPPDGRGLFDGERAQASDDPEHRLEVLEGTIRSIVSEISPMPDAIAKKVSDLDPARSIVFLTRVGALYPAYRASALLENLMGKVHLPTILFYPGTRSGRNSLRFMDSLDALHGYRHKIF
jgi:hypothetical protein